MLVLFIPTQKEYFQCPAFKNKSKTFLRAYNKEFGSTPLKETVMKSISNEANLIGEGLSKKGYNLAGMKNYIVRVYKRFFKDEDLEKDFVKPEKTYMNELDGVALCIPNKIDIVRKKKGSSIGVEKYAARLHVHEDNPMQDIQISRKETLKALDIYEKLEKFPLKSYIQAYKQIGKFCAKSGFQFDIISPNNILIDANSKKINLIDPVGPHMNDGVHGKDFDFSSIHGCDSLFPVLCDFLMQKEHLANLTTEERERWEKSIGVVIAKSIVAGKISGFEQSSKQLRTLYANIDRFWQTDDVCGRYDELLEKYLDIIEESYKIADSLNFKKEAKVRIDAISALETKDFEDIAPVFRRILEAPHQPKVEFPEIINAVLDKFLEYGVDAKTIIPELEKLFDKEIFYPTKKRLYNLFIELQPNNEKFLKEIEKSAKNIFERTLYRDEIENLYQGSRHLSENDKIIIDLIRSEAIKGETLPQSFVDKLWMSRTCANSGENQEISLNNMSRAYKYIDSKKNNIPRISDLVEIHKIVLADTIGQEHIAGRLRTPETDYLIGQIFNLEQGKKNYVSDYSAPKDVIRDLEKLDRYIEENCDKKDIFEMAAYIFAESIRIHPFINGNGRAIRLFTEQFLLNRGYFLTKWPEETLYRKICTNEQMAELLRKYSISIED